MNALRSISGGFRRLLGSIESRMVTGREKGTVTFCQNGPPGASHKRWLSPFLILVLAGLVLTVVPGCANQRLMDLHRGTSCSAENVQEYAKARKLTYEQALDEMRKQDQQLWSQEEARQESGIRSQESGVDSRGQ